MLSDFAASGSAGGALKRPTAESPGASPKKIREFLMTFPVAVFLLAPKRVGKKKNTPGYETAPSQLLNCYGPARFAKMPDEQMWKELCKPQKTGAAWHTEMCSAVPERRGTGLNRWVHALLLYCENTSRNDKKTTRMLR